MPSPNVLEPPSGLSFGDLLDWHLRRGTRPPGSDKQGEPWKKATFAGDVGVSDKQVRNWIANKSLPNDIITIERVLFGRDQKQCTVWRMELRDALKHTRIGGPAPGEAAPVIRAQTDVPASNIPIRAPEHFLGRDDAFEKDVGRLIAAVVSGKDAKPPERWRYTSPYRGLSAMEEKDSD